MKKLTMTLSERAVPQLLYNFFSKKQSKIKGLSEPDHYIHGLERYGIICYKKLHDPQRYFLFAWQIVRNSKLFMRFDKRDRSFIESLAIREHQDEWYRSAGDQLKCLGFARFVEVVPHL